MKNEIIEANIVPTNTNDRMPVTRQDLDTLSEKRLLLKEFVSAQLKQGDDSDGDYAIIQGCKKPSLLKPGAEKLKQLFGLGTRQTLTFKEIDHNGNFAMFVYKCEVFNLKTGVVIAECEGSANSKEKKWATRDEWFKNAQGVNEKRKVETPIYDIINTLMKMAQKRGEVGAVVNATGASDFFTHDMDDNDDAVQLGVKPGGSIETSTKTALGPMTLKGNTHPHKDAIKSVGGKWDMNAKAWVISNPTTQAREMIASLDGIEIS